MLKMPLQNKIHFYEPHADDYYEGNHRLRSAIFQVKNKRAYQEDRATVHELEELALLTKAEKEFVLKKTIANLQKAMSRYLVTGSTICYVAATIDKHRRLHATTAMLGDSRPFLIIKEGEKVVLVKRLATILHNPSDANELRRLSTTGHTVARQGGEDRVFSSYGDWGVSRALGDHGALPHASDHEPDIFTLHDEHNNEGIHLKEGQEAFILVASDGLFDGEWFFEEAIKRETTLITQVFNRHHHPISAAYTLLKKAISHGSEDNITIAVAHVSSKKMLCVGIYDGHGGHEVSEFLKKHFHRTLSLHVSAIHFEKSPRQVIKKTKKEVRPQSEIVLPTPLLGEKDINLCFDKLLNLTNNYLNRSNLSHHKANIFKDLRKTLEEKNQSKYERIKAFKMKISMHDKKILKQHRTKAWKRFLYHAFSILLIFPALIQGSLSIYKYGRLSLFAPKSQKTIECAERELIKARIT